MEVSGQLHDPATFLSEKYPKIPIELEARWAKQPTWTV
jgi:hypothetical protein